MFTPASIGYVELDTEYFYELTFKYKLFDGSVYCFGVKAFNVLSSLGTGSFVCLNHATFPEEAFYCRHMGVAVLIQPQLSRAVVRTLDSLLARNKLMFGI